MLPFGEYAGLLPSADAVRRALDATPLDSINSDGQAVDILELAWTIDQARTKGAGMAPLAFLANSLHQPWAEIAPSTAVQLPMDRYMVQSRQRSRPLGNDR